MLRDVTLEVNANTMVGVLGPTDGGKTTLLKLMAGVQNADKGTAELSGAASLPKRVAYVPRVDTLNWNAPLTVWDVAMMARPGNYQWFQNTGDQDRDFVRSCLVEVGLWEHRSLPIRHLCGDQRQRVVIARALAQEAKVIILDELLSGTDAELEEGFIDLLQSTVAADRIVMLSAHNLARVSNRFDKILCVNQHICAFGPPEAIYKANILDQLYNSHSDEFSPNHLDPDIERY